MKSIHWQISKSIRSWLPRLQAHRGYWVGGLPQNTLSSIEKSYDLNYQMVEFDVRLTADKMVILFHDDTIDGLPISKLNFEDIMKLNPVSTLEEVCFWLSKQTEKNFKFNIELKTSAIFSSTLEKKVSRIIQHFKLESQILISSFNPLALGRMRFLCKNVFRALLLTLEEHPRNKWYFRKMIFNFFAKPHALHLRYEDWTEKSFAKISKLVPVVLWTYNELEQKMNLNRHHEISKKLYTDVIHGVISDDITPDMNV